MLVGGVEFFSKIGSEVRASDRHQVFNWNKSNTLVEEYLATSNKVKSFLERDFDEITCSHLLSKIRIV